MIHTHRSSSLQSLPRPTSSSPLLQLRGDTPDPTTLATGSQGQRRFEMATLSNIASMTGAATAHVDADAAQKAPAAPAAAAASGTTLPADGEVLADATAYRTIDHKFLSHTNGVVIKQPVSLKLVPGGSYQLVAGSQETYLLDPADWELRPASIDQIVPTVHTLKAASDTTKEVVLAGEFEGEDLPLYDFEIRYRGGLKNALLHPNRPGAEHKLAEGQSKLVRLGFEQQQEAKEWYALLSIALGTLDLDSPTLASLPKALAASKKARSYKAAA